MRTFLEFFAGGGMARAGLGAGWRCLFANDFDFKKALTYRRNWGADGLRVDDIHRIAAEETPMGDLVWGSFPCQDLSLAGAGAGLEGARSGTFHAFWRLVEGWAVEGRAPKIVALENVVGTLTSHGGADFRTICASFARLGYRYGALTIDAALFVPQSRPRLFFVGVRDDVAIAPELTAPGPLAPFHSQGLRRAAESNPSTSADRWVWWNLPVPPRSNRVFADLIEDVPSDVAWRGEAETAALLAMMSPLNLAKVEAAKRAGRRMVGTVYKRTRVDETGRKVQRAEVRFDDVSGCLRTPAGGSSRQSILVVDGDRIRSRLVSSRETARLMGLPDDYRLPERYNEAYHLTGDGVVVPVVRHLAEHLFEPLLDESSVTTEKRAAAM